MTRGGIAAGLSLVSLALLAASLLACDCSPEMTLAEIEAYRAEHRADLLSRTVRRPWRDEPWTAGTPGGTWNSAITADPKSFNLLIAERDAETDSILAPTTQYLVDYNPVKKEWEPKAASFRIEQNGDGSLDLVYTLRDDLFWSFIDGRGKVPVTSDDVIFWYDEIQGDQEMGSSAYNSQFMTMEDGSESRVEIRRIDGKSFAFHFPRAVAEPLLHTNMSFGPSFAYRKAKESGGAQGVKDLFSAACDVREIPSCGPYFIAEYTPGQRVVYARNDDYWERDSLGRCAVYPDRRVCRITGDRNTELLLFKKGEMEAFSPSPEQLDEIVRGAANAIDGEGRRTGADRGYTAFSADGAMSAPFWTFNQNPVNAEKPFYRWFTKKEFRQAMSRLLNRDRIISQTYRGLAEPMLSFFPEANAYFDPGARLAYTFDRAEAAKLLESAGFSLGQDGILRDEEGTAVEFDLTIVATNPVYGDIAQIIADECKKAGITVNVRQTDFQKLVEQMTSTYDWQSLMIGLSGGNVFPTQGSNVWVSSGNLHIWNPLQKSPATDWEARVDELYAEAGCLPDHDRAAPLWSEYQKIFLEQCPLVYLVRSRSFFALQNRWDMSNAYYDNMNGAKTERLFLRE